MYVWPGRHDKMHEVLTQAPAPGHREMHAGILVIGSMDRNRITAIDLDANRRDWFPEIRSCLFVDIATEGDLFQIIA